jgi:hypothetical protein
VIFRQTIVIHENWIRLDELPFVLVCGRLSVHTAPILAPRTLVNRVMLLGLVFGDFFP